MTEKKKRPLKVAQASDKQGKNEPKTGTICQATALAMTGSPPVNWPDFPERFHVVTDSKGERLMFQENDRVVRPIAPAVIDAAILNYWQNVIPAKKGWAFSTPKTIRIIRDARAYWLHHAEPTPAEDILPVAFATDLALSYHRLHFDPVDIAPNFELTRACPHMGEFMSRTSNAAAFLTWIGSLFDPYSPRQQYCWMQGCGNDGKGTLTRKLQRLFGPSFGTEQPPSPQDKFWTSGIVGKRLIVFPDANNRSFVTSGLFKSLTGEDPIRVEYKGGAIATMDLNTKYLFISNANPKVTDNRADMRRIIYCHITPPETYYEGDYEAEMWAEMPIFISYCWHLYQRHLKTRGSQPIPTEDNEVLDIARHNTAEYDTILEQHFSATGKPEQCPSTANEVQSVLKRYYPNSKSDRDKLRDYFVKTFDTTQSRPYIKGRQTRVYEGVYTRPEPISGP